MNAKVNPDKTGKGKRQMYRVMIVDDEPLILAGIASLLDWKEYGCEISGKAANGQQALKLMEEQKPDIVITDIKMPMTVSVWTHHVLQLTLSQELAFWELAAFLYEVIPYAVLQRLRACGPHRAWALQSERECT